MNKKIEVNEALVKHVADLARLKIKDSEIFQYQKNFQDILDYVSVLDEVNTEGVAPMFSAVEENINLLIESQKNKFKSRNDEVASSLKPSEVVLNAPQTKNNEFMIEAVIEE